MPRAPRFARAAKHNSPSGGKKSVRGNNRFGSRGCIKCDECRRRKTRCEFDESNPDEPCRDCKRRGTECGKTLPAQTNGRVSDYADSLSPTPSEVSSTIFGPSSEHYAGEVKVESNFDNAPVSLLLENARIYAADLQTRNPHWSKDRVLVALRDSIAHGDFGDLTLLLQSPSGKAPSNSPIVVQSKPPANKSVDYPASYFEPHYPGPEMPQMPAYAGTINPATLTVNDSFSFTDALNGDESPRVSFVSDPTRDAEVTEAGAPYYKEVQPPFERYHTSMGYGPEQYDPRYSMYR